MVRNRDRVGRRTDRSEALYRRACAVLVEGVSSPSRGTANYHPFPLFMEGGEGGEIIDADGNRYLDIMLGYGALIHGHAHPRLTAALREAAERGALRATANETEVEVAERICRTIPGAERVRFANTGTEAAMGALRLARGYTGRRKFIKFEGHYHGWSDPFSVSSNPLPSGAIGHYNDPIPIPDSSGITPGALEDTILVPWNDADRVEAALKRYPGQIAAIVTEPVMANMGVISPGAGYLAALRELADRHDTLLYIDETVTGFRLGIGGAQGRFGVQADIVTFGKALGAGFPVAAIAGRAEIMGAMRWGGVLHYGTQNANPTLLAVTGNSIDMLNEGNGEAYRRLDALADQVTAGLRRVMAEAAVPALVQNVGPMLQIFFLLPGHEHVTAIGSFRDFAAHVDRERFNRFAHAMFDQGVYLSPSAALHSVLATVHTPQDMDRIIAAARAVLSNGQRGLIEPPADV
ncbi:MAG TPA: glutamate-1-semialdehyde 2,1-aminomutase [Chloroflexota bacterium]|nr:glutamate-1-semialdehyde 2,1-aminomutase [Chloroflexota bacterium]